MQVQNKVSTSSHPETLSVLTIGDLKVIPAHKHSSEVPRGWTYKRKVFGNQFKGDVKCSFQILSQFSFQTYVRLCVDFFLLLDLKNVCPTFE